jgi:inhibitor of cysteine peptidase
VEHRLTRDDHGGRLAVAVGDAVVVTLPETATTGYRWEPDVDPAALRVESAAPVAAAEPRGAPGERLVRVVALRPGTAELRLLLKRSWETEPADRFEVALDVAG